MFAEKKELPYPIRRLWQWIEFDWQVYIIMGRIGLLKLMTYLMNMVQMFRKRQMVQFMIWLLFEI